MRNARLDISPVATHMRAKSAGRMLEIDGGLQAFGAIVSNIVDFDPVFNIVTP